MENIFLIGASEHAKVIIDIIEKEGKYFITGLVDANPQLRGKKILGYEVVGDENEIPDLIKNKNVTGVFIAIGDNWVRGKVVKKIQSAYPELKFINAIHPSSSIGKGVTLGIGNAVMAGAVINPSTEIGNFTIINSRSSIDHDNIINDFASIAPGVVTGGKVTIGDFSAISIGAVLKHGVTIGEHVVIGAAALVMGNIEPFCVAYGSPAKFVRERKEGDRYL